MGAVKSWLMTIEECVEDAIQRALPEKAAVRWVRMSLRREGYSASEELILQTLRRIEQEVENECRTS